MMPSLPERAPDPRPARTRAAIFAAARDLSAHDGEVTVNALAKRAGVSRAAFYSHFTGIDDLLAAILQQMFAAARERGHELALRGLPIQQAIRFGFGMHAEYVERHHAFLRGVLDLKFSHRTYMITVDAITELHELAMDLLGDQVPSLMRREATCRSIAGGSLALTDSWLVRTEQRARDGETLDATELLELMLRNAPDWYTGLGPEEPIGAEEIMTDCRAFLAAAAEPGAGAPES